MSIYCTRKGNVIKLEDILDTARDTMHHIMRSNDEKYAQIENPEETADIVGKAAIMIQDMSARRYTSSQHPPLLQD
jgi:arginyl-tRNA synthetase